MTIQDIASPKIFSRTTRSQTLALSCNRVLFDPIIISPRQATEQKRDSHHMARRSLVLTKHRRYDVYMLSLKESIDIQIRRQLNFAGKRSASFTFTGTS